MGGGCAKPRTEHFHSLKASMPGMKGKTVAITGCTSGIGFVLAKSVAELGANVIMLNRKSKKAEEAWKQVKAVSHDVVTWIECDLMSFDSVRQAAAEMKQKFSASGINVLCNNAGILTFPDKPTVDGYDPLMQFNHLSHFLLTQQVWNLLVRAGRSTGEASRVINHTSGARMMNKKPFDLRYYGNNGGQIDDDREVLLARLKNHPLGLERYCQSKLANIIFTYALEKRLKVNPSVPVKAIVAHPGLSATRLMGISDRLRGAAGMMACSSQSQEGGTMGVLRACCDPDANSGDFFGPSGGAMSSGPAVRLPREDNLASEERCDQLWKASEEATGVAFCC